MELRLNVKYIKLITTGITSSLGTDNEDIEMVGRSCLLGISTINKGIRSQETTAN